VSISVLVFNSQYAMVREPAGSPILV